jgi:SAM-dependent methyltransferase
MVSDELETFRARRRSFGAAAAAYAAYRPGYPDSAIDWALRPLPHASEPTVLDLGAGTGKLTESLAARFITEDLLAGSSINTEDLLAGSSISTEDLLAGSSISRVIAVEPDHQMLDVLRERLPAVPSMSGSAERIPLPDASVDAVLVGQAFHWFDAELAGAEIARVLRPGGLLAGLWNAEDDSVPWLADYHRAIYGGPRGNGVPKGSEPDELPGAPYFGPTERGEFRHAQRLTVDGLIDVQGTHSVTLLSEPAEREQMFGRIRDYFAGRPELTDSPDSAFDLPLRTIVLRTIRLAVRR